MTSISLPAYYDMLEQHDWYFNFSDDIGVWRRGNCSLENLTDISKQSPQHLELFNGFNAHKFSGEPWKTEKAPKPERPK